jgi:DnaJ-class molecular chaperone
MFENYVVVCCPKCRGQGMVPWSVLEADGLIDCETCKGFGYVRVHENKLEIYGENDEEDPTCI